MTRSTSAPDQASRDLALDPTRSVIVQAPAGSGKTTLLAQRYINLLARVQRPEEILAITFTKKAAAEMRHRVLESLLGNSEAAIKVKQHSEAMGWDIFTNPNLLKIQTIDSFALEIASQIPGEHSTRGLSIVENAMAMYQEAAQTLFNRLYEDNPTNTVIAEFLAFLDNDINRATRLISSMLARRDQWLHFVTAIASTQPTEQDQVKGILSKATHKIRAEAEEKLRSRLTPLDLERLGVLATLFGCTSSLFDILPRLMTKAGSLRKRFTAKDGFAEPTYLKEVNLWLKELYERDLAADIEAFVQLPPEHLEHNQVSLIHLSCVCLSLAVIELDFIFSKAAAIDFTGLLIRAKQALHDHHGNPTDLALYLDYRISHVLIDEFQDTSRSQLELFQAVIRAWQDDANTTFFCVGDPMQSIYKFRDADVAVFTECREHGIGDVSLEANYLSANFRSDPRLVEWCNETFAHLFASSSTMQLGGVAYNPSQAVVKAVSSAAVSFTSFEDERIESNETVARIQHLLNQDDRSSIAILCRARTHVAALIKLLDAKNIDWQATDMDSLATKPIILDLLSLHSTLLDPGARLAWFSILRSPMFGFTLTQLSEYAEDQNLLHAITQRHADDPRLSRLLQAHTWATQHLHELTLREVLEGYWFRCGGIAAYPGQAQQQAQSFLDLLDDMGDVAHNRADLEFALSRLFGDAQTEARVEIMTIHKSKGLEFDHVLVPYLHKRSRPDEPQLLLWRENRDGFLMGVREDPIHNWLKFADRTRNQNEEKRLLYVACTRAKTSLWLSFTQQESRKVGGIARFIQTIATPFEDLATPLDVRSKLEQADVFSSQGLTRLPKNYVWSAPAVLELPPSNAVRIAVADVIGSRREVALGVIVHQALAWQAHQQCDVAETMGRLPSWLAQQQIDDADIEPLLARARDHLGQTFTDPTGQWILEPHAQHECEVALSGVVNRVVIHVVLDRMFISDGVRWIVDYKTTDLNNHNIDAAVARYRPQLQQYTQVVADLFPEPVRSGLYFTHSSQFVEL